MNLVCLSLRPYVTDALPEGRELLLGADPETGRVCDNVFFLNKAQVMTLHGFRIAVLPGKYNEISFNDDSTIAKITAGRCASSTPALKAPPVVKG